MRIIDSRLRCEAVERSFAVVKVNETGLIKPMFAGLTAAPPGRRQLTLIAQPAATKAIKYEKPPAAERLSRRVVKCR